jgi:nucleotide-binding universal stress UspA family protein
MDAEPKKSEGGAREPEAAFQEYVARLFDQAGVADVPWTTRVVAGDAPEIILQAAEGSRMTVMATHGRGGFHAAFIGSVTDKIVRAAAGPVLTIPVEGQVNLMAGPALVGLDGSERAEQALPFVRDLAPRLGVGIALLRAYSVTPSAGSEFIVYEYDAVSILKDAAEEYLKGVAREGETTFTAMMSPAAAVEQGAEQIGAGLIALTSRGRGLAYRLTLGSTTDRVIHSVRRPVLVLPAD